MKKQEICEECGGDKFEKDNQGFRYCIKCGLVLSPMHKYGHGVGSLLSYCEHNRLENQITTVRSIVVAKGLRAGRLYVANLEK